MTPIFPALDSPEFNAEFDAVPQLVADLQQLFDRYQVRARENSLIDAAFAAQFDEIINALNALRLRLRALGSYLNCFVTTDARNDLAQSRASQLENTMVPLQQLQARLLLWIASSDIETLLQLSEVAREHEFWLRRAREMGQHQMSESEENLAASLRPMGLSGWAKLHSDLSALLTANVEIEGETQTLPISAVRALANDPRAEVRRAAYEAEIAAWQANEVPFAAALNGIKGFQRELRARRDYIDDVQPTLTANSIDSATLDAMQSACEEAFPDLRRYLKAKARLQGSEKLAWYDMMAPISADEDDWNWARTTDFVREQFAAYSPRLANFAQRTFDENWIDAPPAVGKVGGAYCTGTRPGESRVLMNFDGSFNALSTLAHELGHAYHNLTLEPRTSLQSGVPATLAETASIFCETIIFEAAIKNADDAQKLALLDNALGRDLQVIVDIHSRFLFERAVFEKRGARDLTPQEFCDLMTQAQQATYGEVVEPLHPYMWAVKGHYYGPTFYNYPYTFGLLFGLGLYARYQKEPETFRAQYDDFLSKCGMADAKTLAAQFGVDTTSVEFWRSSLDIVRAHVAEFERLSAR